MKNDRETRDKILKSAKQEFLEKGYMQASLRNICKNAGVTTGALYFFFQDKEDLLVNLVQQPLDNLYQILYSHYEQEIEDTSFLGTTRFEDIKTDIEAAKQMVHHIYQNYDVFQLVLVKSQGSRYETCIDQIVALTENHYRMLADRIATITGTEKLDDYTVHWLSHMQIDAFVHLLTHEKSEEEALKRVESIVTYMIAGWFELFKKKK